LMIFVCQCREWWLGPAFATANAPINRVRVLPISSQACRLDPVRVLLILKRESRQAMVAQIATHIKRRLLRRFRTIGEAEMASDRNAWERQ
jgi:hypothetical protein